MSIEQQSLASWEQCRVLSWLEVRRDRGTIDAATFKKAFSELLVPRTPDRVAHVRERLNIPPGFAPVAPLDDHQRQRELDWIENGLRRTYLGSYGGRHVVDGRFVVLHLCGNVGVIVMSARERASFGTRIWAEPARFSLPELEVAMVRLRRDIEELQATESVNSLYLDIEANTVVVGAAEDVDGLRSRLRQRYGDAVSTEYNGGATCC